MAITAQALALVPGAPGPTALSGSGTFVWSPGDVQQPFAQGTVTFVGDGATTAAVINWVDGVIALGFTPSHVQVELITAGGAGTDTAGVLRAEGSAASKRVTAVSTTTATVNYSTAIANAATSVLFVKVYR